MVEPFIGTIILWAGSYVPEGWDLCAGQLININQNPALYSLIGTFYGGDGRNTFQLPDLRNRAPISAISPAYYGQGIPAQSTNSYLTNTLSVQMSTFGSGTLNSTQLPSHTHVATFIPNASGSTANVPIAIPVNTQPSSANNPAGAYLAQTTDIDGGSPSSYENSSNSVMAPFPVSTSIPGGSAQVVNAPTGSGGPFTFPVSGNVVTPVLPYISLSYIIALQGIYPERP